MKKLCLRLVALLMAASALLCLSACGGEGNTSPSPSEPAVSSAEPSSEPSEEAQQESASPAEETDSGDAEAVSAYRAALNALLNDHIFPDGSAADYDNSDMSNNKFALYDVDGDGHDELIIQYVTGSMAGQVEYVLGYDADAKQLRTELLEFPFLTYYDNGIIKAGWSHNQGLAGDVFWPFDLYEYDSVTDSYVNVGIVDAWDKSYAAEDYNGNAFPDDVDVSGAGIVYYLMTNGEYETVAPVDSAVYTDWYDSYLAGAGELAVPYTALTSANIEAIG